MMIPALLAGLALGSIAAATPTSAPVSKNLILDVPAPAAIPPPFVGGRRATTRVYVDAAGFSYVTASPTEAFRWVRFDPVGLTTRIGVYPDSVVRYFTEPSGGEAVWTSFAARDAPWVAMLVERDSTKGEPCRMKMTCSPSLDYISKFGGAGKQRFRWVGNGLEITSATHPELLALFLTDARITPHGAAEGEIESVGELSCNLEFGAGKGFVVAGSGKAEFIRAATAAMDSEKVARELAAVRAAEQAFLDDGAQLETPDPELNRFFRLTRSWFRKDVRILPFGEPWTTDLSKNQEIPVLTASPDYHGVFANDCVQTALEGSLVAPSLGPIFRNDLDVLYKHSANCDGYIPESVEDIFGGQELYIQPMRIGQHPEWVVSLASVALLSGDRDLGNRLWPGVELALKYFVDTNGDGVNEWDTAAYPEQPDTTGYRNGMLYAQAWWVWAYDRAAELAKFLGKTGEESDLRARGEKAAKAMEKVFGRDDGYGVWLSPEGKLHPHHGHEMIIPVAIGLASPERAEKVLRTMQSSEVWLDPYGPYRANRGSGLIGGGSVWEFMRWQFVQALFMGGKSDLGARYAGAWARQELARGLDAPESFPTPITGFTGQGYVWAAGRATRALTCGLFGLQPMADGLRVNPRLPSSWKKMSLKSIPFRGKTITVIVKRGGKPAATLNGRPWTDPIVEESSLKAGENVLEITLAQVEAKTAPAESAAKGGNMTQRFLDTLQGKLRFDSARAPWGGLAFCAQYSWFGVNKQDKLGIESLWLYYNRAPRLLSSEFLTFEVSRSDQTSGASSNRADLPLEIREQGDHGFSGAIVFAESDIVCYHAAVAPDSGATVTARLSIPAIDPRFIRKVKYDPANRLLTIDTRLPRTDARDPDPDHPFTICMFVPEAFSPGAGLDSETDEAVHLTFSARAEDFNGEQTFIVGIGEGPTVDEIRTRLHGMARIGSKDSRAASRRWLNNSLDKFTFEGIPQDLRLHYAKAVYQLLSNTKAPRGRLKHPAGYPSRGVYCTEFLWDVAFSSIAVAQFNRRLAEDYLLNLVENQEADGKIPMFICATWNRPGESEPPLIAWSAWSLYERSRNKKLISAVYGPLGRMVEWWFEKRDQDGNGVVEYQDPLESGWDNSPRFDAGRIEGVDLNAYLNREIRLLAKMAKVLGKQEDVKAWERRAAEHAERVSAVLFDPEGEIYYDRLVEQKSLLKTLTPASFTPLWTGMPVPEKTAKSMIERYLLDPDRFYGKYPFPTVAYNEPTYTPGGWWRGPVWVNIAWIMVETLKANGFEKESKEASRRLIDMMLGNDELYELYNSSTGKGQGCAGYGWTNAAFMEMARKRE